MLLSQLYKNFGKSSPEEQAEYVAAYRLRRAADLATTPANKKRKLTAGTVLKKLVLSEEEKLLMKLLGLKQKDILAMRELKTSIDEADLNDTALLNDSTFEEGDE
jgi:hypothetical protein